VASALNSTGDLVALAGVGAGALALISCALLAWTVRRLRSAQRAILGVDHEVDLVAHAAALTREVVALRDYLDDVAARLDGRLAAAEQRLDRAISHRALVRYDAYNEMSGHQSLSIALLDATRSGIVLSSILHRDQARLYVKQVHEGQSELKLSPEEEEALQLALLHEQ
jgi:hypothetical protein